MSSRNTYLSPAEREIALRLSRSLKAAQELVDRGEIHGEAVLRKVREVLESGGGLRSTMFSCAIRTLWTTCSR